MLNHNRQNTLTLVYSSCRDQMPEIWLLCWVGSWVWRSFSSVGGLHLSATYLTMSYKLDEKKSPLLYVDVHWRDKGTRDIYLWLGERGTLKLQVLILSYLIKFRDVSTSQFSSYQRAIEGSSMSYLGWKTDLEKCTMATVLLLLLD